MATGLILASKIAAITDDDGTGTTGTVIDKTWMQQLDAGATIDVAVPLVFKLSGNSQVEIFANSDRSNALKASAFDNGANGGCSITLERNSHSTTPAAAFILMEDKSGTDYFLWVDDSGVLRIHTAVPTNANDTAGTVVGTQT
jgi:hypothetical protein